MLERVVRNLTNCFDGRNKSCAQATNDAIARHALARLRDGYDLRYLIADYEILRECIADAAVDGATVDPVKLRRMHTIIDEAIIHSVACYVDERQRLLQESDDRWQAIIDTATVLIFIKDREGRYLLVNRFYEELFHCERRTVLGKTDYDLHPRELADEWRRKDTTVLEQNRPLEAEEVVTIAGESKTFLIHKFPLRRRTGEPYGVCGIGTDITERKRLEEARELFVAMLGHDLRNPLSVQLTAVSLLEDSDDLTEIQDMAIRAIARSARTMNTMIRDILDFTRGRLGGGIPIMPQPMDMAEVCRRVIDASHLLHPRRKVSLVTKGDLHGQWDCNRVEQTLTNLIANAIQHGSDPITVVAVETENGAVQVEVTNQGTPISAAQCRKIFEPFRRDHRRSQGLGLGLYIVSEIVRAHGGSIEVVSTQQGTVFKIIWPRARKLAPPTSASA